MYHSGRPELLQHFPPRPTRVISSLPMCVNQFLPSVSALLIGSFRQNTYRFQPALACARNCFFVMTPACSWIGSLLIHRPRLGSYFADAVNAPNSASVRAEMQTGVTTFI